MKKYGKIAIMVLFAGALLAGCGDGTDEPEQTINDPLLKFLTESDAAIERIDLPLAVAEKVTFKTEDGVELSADYYPGKGPNPAGILLMPSIYIADRREWDPLIDDLVSKGYAVLAPDLGDHGESSRKPSSEEFQENFVTARSFLEKKGVPKNRIVIITLGEDSCKILGNAHNCKGAICLLPHYSFDLEKHPGNWYYYFPEPSLISAPRMPSPPAGNDREVKGEPDTDREVKGEPNNWMLIELRAKNPDLTSALVDGLRLCFKTSSVPDIFVRTKDDGIIQIIAPETQYNEVAPVFKSSKLEFKAEAPNEIVAKYAEADEIFRKTKVRNHPVPPEGYEVHDIPKQGGWILVETAPSITSKDFENFRPDNDVQGHPVVSFRLRKTAVQRFGDLTAKLKEEERRLAIILDGEVISAPGINEAIRSGNGIITMGGGNKSKQDRFLERNQMLVSLNAGILAPVHDQLRMYLIVSMKDGKAQTAPYYPGILGRKYGEFDVNENILRDIESILVAKKK